MGGHGSGRGGVSRRPLAESMRRIDLAMLRREEPSLTVRHILQVSCLRSDGEKVEVANVYLESTRMYFGGRRLWFRCPIRPPCISTICLAVASPRPVPPLALVSELSTWWNCSKIRPCWSSGIPGPVSVTETAKWPLRAPAARRASLSRKNGRYVLDRLRYPEDGRRQSELGVSSRFRSEVVLRGQPRLLEMRASEQWALRRIHRRSDRVLYTRGRECPSPQAAGIAHDSGR